MKSCSVIIPTRDRPAYLLRAVKSAFAALPKDGEVIVVDDASDIPATECLTDFNTEHLTVLRNAIPLGGGGSPSRNLGATAANARVLFFLDDDDELMPDYCKRVLASGADTTADFGFGARKFVSTDASGKSTCSVEKRVLPAGQVSADQPFERRAFPFSGGFWITRAAFESAGVFATTLATNSDTEYCCRLFSKGLNGWYSPEPAVAIHQHQIGAAGQLDNVTKRIKSADRAAAFRYIANEYKQYFIDDPSAAFFVHQRWMKHALRAGQVADARQAVLQVSQLRIRSRLRLQFESSRLFNTLFARAPN